MSTLVRHFGDVEDAKQACGVCDVCDPAGAVLRQFRRASGSELEIARRIVEELRGWITRLRARYRRILTWWEESAG